MEDIDRIKLVLVEQRVQTNGFLNISHPSYWYRSCFACGAVREYTTRIDKRGEYESEVNGYLAEMGFTL